MKLGSVASAGLPVAVIVLISFGASHVFQRVDAIIQLNGIHPYRYIAYVATIILAYVCASKYNKYLAFSLSVALAALAILGQQKVIDSFPLLAPFFAILMGVFSVLLVPAAKGRGFVQFLFVLILPALLAESRLGGSILPTSEGVFTYEVYAVTVAVVGGYFYLRYIASAALTHQELLSKGASEEDTRAISWWNSFIAGMVVAAATATTVLLATTSIRMNTLQPYFAGLPLHILLLETVIGVIVVAIIYYFRTLAGKIEPYEAEIATTLSQPAQAKH